jgi:hypothetical protein
MKSPGELIFNNIIKDGFTEILKPLGFKKKGNNFYRNLEQIGHVVNVQKTVWGTKEKTNFSINVGVFVPEFWMVYFNFHNKEIPDFPLAVDCLINKRIGAIRNDRDIWFEVSNETDEPALRTEIRRNVKEYILPYLEKFDSRENLLQHLGVEDMPLLQLGKMITYGEFTMLDDVKAEYQRLLTKYTDPDFQKKIRNFGRKYNLEK